MKKILIVEDEPAYLELLYSKLSHTGFTVIKASDGQKGLTLARLEKPDLILLDIRMPVMDGMTMLGLLRKEEIKHKSKVIILTNLEPDDKIIGSVMANQPSYYFVKSDIQFDDLLAKIRELLAD